MNVTEHGEQALVIQWAKINEFIHPELFLLFSTLNGIPLIGMGGRQRAIVIHHMKEEGMKVGLPDLWLPVARGGYHGLVIELKVGNNKPSQEQERWLDELDKQGYKAVALWGADEAIKMIEEYLAS